MSEDIYSDSRQVIADKLRASVESLKHHERILEQTHGTLSWSNLWQELAVQAALQACMMGAAGRIGGAVAAKNAKAADAAAKGRWAGARFGIEVLSDLKTAAMKLAIRVGIGCSVVVVRKLYGKAYRDDAFFDAQLLVGLGLATFCGVVGVPGEPVKGLFLTGPGIKSWQTLIQSIGVAGAVGVWMRSPENAALANFMREHRQGLITSSKEAAAKIGDECVAWALENEHTMASKTGQEIRKIDFTKQLNLSTRLNDKMHDIKIVNILREQTAQCAMAETRKTLWVTISQTLREIELERLALEGTFKQVA